jgi:hypothetical protein
VQHFSRMGWNVAATMRTPERGHGVATPARRTPVPARCAG